jgi:nucleoside-diphosphate-sugar epimerase
MSEQESARPAEVVLVSGATSQVGRFLLPRLVAAGYRVHAVSRTPPGPSTGSITWHRADLSRHTPGLELERLDHMIHIAPIWLLPEQLDRVAALGLHRVVAFSSTSCVAKARSRNPQERAAANRMLAGEQALKERSDALGIRWTLFRPTLIYGCGMDKNITVIARFVRRFHFFPIVGDGAGLRRPVHADDLAEACVRVLGCSAAFDRAYDLSGAETLPYREMVARVFESLGQHPHIVRIPLALFRSTIRLAASLPSLRHLTPDMADRINTDMAFDHQLAARDFGFAPRPFQPPPLR